MKAICCNHHCDQFERPVNVSDVVSEAEQSRCEDCRQALVHETGLTFRDALDNRLAARWKVGGTNITVFCDTDDLDVVARIEESARNAGVELVRDRTTATGGQG